MNYTLNQLRIFSTVVQHGSISRAAEALHLTQPAVSIQLRNFQEQFELPLTEVISKRLYITDFGKEIAAAADKILDEVYAINYKTLAYSGQLSGRLKLSAVSTGKYIIPYFLSGFLKQHPGLELQLDVTNKAHVVDSLEKNEVDFALVSVLPAKLDLGKVELMQNKLYLVGNRDKKFRNREYNKSILEDIPLIYRETGSGTRVVMERFIARNRLPVQKKLELTSNEAVKQAVIAGLGYSIMPLIGIRNELQNGTLQIIPVKGFPIRSTWTLIWLKQKRFSPAAQAFLNYIRTEKERVIREQFSWYETF